MSDQQTREKAIYALILELLSIIGGLAVVVMADPGLRADARVILKKVGLALIGEPLNTEPAPVDVRGLIDAAEDITKEAAQSEGGK